MTELNLDYTKKLNVVSFDISGVRIILFKSANVDVIFTCEDGTKLLRVVIIDGEDYLKWSNDDNFIVEFIKENAQRILYQ